MSQFQWLRCNVIDPRNERLDLIVDRNVDDERHGVKERNKFLQRDQHRALTDRFTTDIDLSLKLNQQLNAFHE